jgi:hypothetical protein
METETDAELVDGGEADAAMLIAHRSQHAPHVLPLGSGGNAREELAGEPGTVGVASGRVVEGLGGRLYGCGHVDISLPGACPAELQLTRQAQRSRRDADNGGEATDPAEGAR